MKGKNGKSQVLEACQSSNEEDSSLLDVHDIARYLKVQRSTIYSLTETKQIPHYRVGRQIRFKKPEIEKWLEERKEPAVDAIVEARKVIRSLQRKPNLDVDRIVKKTIEDVRGRQYTSLQEKPGRIKGLGKEVEDGII